MRDFRIWNTDVPRCMALCVEAPDLDAAVHYWWNTYPNAKVGVHKLNILDVESGRLKKVILTTTMQIDYQIIEGKADV